MSKKGICNQYSASGICSYGTQCKFKHVRTTARFRSSASGTCRQFAKTGWCTYGDHCKFSHVGSSRRAKARNNGSVRPGVARIVKSFSKTSKGFASGNESPLADFFAEYSYANGFSYDAEEAANSEFYRLCDFMGWERDDADRVNAHEEFKDALTKQFNANFGTDENDITAWQTLCACLGIEPIPDDLGACQKAVADTHVNLVDLTDGYSSSREVYVFTTEKALSAYTIANGRFFPKESAYAGGLLRYLLRQIMNPSEEI